MSKIKNYIQIIKAFDILADYNLFKVLGIGWVLAMAGYAIISSKKNGNNYDSRFNLKDEAIKDKIFMQQLNKVTKKN